MSQKRPGDGQSGPQEGVRAAKMDHFWMSCIGLGSGVISNVYYEDYG